MGVEDKYDERSALLLMGSLNRKVPVRTTGTLFLHKQIQPARKQKPIINKGGLDLIVTFVLLVANIGVSIQFSLWYGLYYFRTRPRYQYRVIIRQKFGE